MRRAKVWGSRGFPGVALLGLLAVGVTWLITGARRRRALSRSPFDPRERVIIDGAKPADPHALEARPTTESNSPTNRLESEADVDVFSVRERW